MKRGHSNVHAERTEPWPGNEERDRVPIEGGADVTTVKELPPLALSHPEWLTIGEAMGWTTKRKLLKQLL